MHMLYLLRILPGVLPDTRFVNNCHVLFLSLKLFCNHRNRY